MIDPSLEFLDSVLEKVFEVLDENGWVNNELEALLEVWEFDRGQREKLAALDADAATGTGRVDNADTISPKQRVYIPWFGFRTTSGLKVNTYVEVSSEE